MNERHKKILFWVSAISIYTLMVAAVFNLLRESNNGLPLSQADAGTASLQDWANIRSLLAGREADGVSGLLVPMGPDDGYLPGQTEIWDVFMRAAGSRGSARPDTDGFDGLQSVADPEKFFRSAVSELFLSGTPRQIFRRGSNLLFLNNKGHVQVIDCRNRREPKAAGSLPYGHVRYMQMRGDQAYLLLTPSGTQYSNILVADLKNPQNPRQLALIRLDNRVTSFYLADGHLVVSSLSAEQDAEPLIELYALGHDFLPVHLGKISSSLMNRGFLRFGTYLLVPGSRSGMQVCDVSDPLNPVVVASIEFADSAKYFVQQGKTAFVMGSLNAMYVLDLEDPAHPEISTVAAEVKEPAYFIRVGEYTYYFTMRGYLEAFDLPPKTSGVLRGKQAAGLVGAGFDQADAAHMIDVATWRDGLAVLRDDGLVSILRGGRGLVTQLPEELKLPGGQRWLAAGRDRLYVGGQSAITVLALNTHNQLVLTGRAEVPGPPSWDGLVVGETLCVAAGKIGLMTFSLASPDQPAAMPAWSFPRYFSSLIDVRQLATPGGDRVLAAAGPLGLLDGRVVAGQFQITGLLGLSDPVSAIAATDQFCLAATAKHVCVIDIRGRHVLQNLGDISFPGVARLAMVPPGSWAGFVPGPGWLIFPGPQLLEPGDFARLRHVESPPAGSTRDLYRLKLFDAHRVYNVPGFVLFSPPSGTRVAGDGY